MIKPESKGSGIMVSDFIDKFHGFLVLSDSEYETAKQSNPEIRKYFWEFLKSERVGRATGLETNLWHR